MTKHTQQQKPKEPARAALRLSLDDHEPQHLLDPPPQCGDLPKCTAKLLQETTGDGGGGPGAASRASRTAPASRNAGTVAWEHHLAPLHRPPPTDNRLPHEPEIEPERASTAPEQQQL